MVTLNMGALASPLGIVRLLQVIFTCISFSLVASVGHLGSSYWAWCMFTWCFCFCVTLLIIILEFSSLNARLPISWEDFTAAFSMLATLMVRFKHKHCPRRDSGLVGYRLVGFLQSGRLIMSH